MKKIGLFFGGMGNEHEVSLASAKNIITHIDTSQYHLILLYCTKEGFFYKLPTLAEREHLQPERKISFEEIKNEIDIALPMTHGKY
jgi:D-alanine-D-alanine ligase